MSIDPIVDELDRQRTEQMESYRFDFEAFFRDLKEQERLSPQPIQAPQASPSGKRVTSMGSLRDSAVSNLGARAAFCDDARTDLPTLSHTHHGRVRDSQGSQEGPMAIQKQEFYEGAALHQLARGGGIAGIRYDHPFFIVNDKLVLCLKYSTKGSSPWAFTFAPGEQVLMQDRAAGSDLVIGLICGADGIASLTYAAYQEIASPRKSSVHLSCYRRHGQRYAIAGPDGELDRKIAPSLWQHVTGD
jgi:hypothetical protein